MFGRNAAFAHSGSIVGIPSMLATCIRPDSLRRVAAALLLTAIAGSASSTIAQGRFPVQTNPGQRRPIPVMNRTPGPAAAVARNYRQEPLPMPVEPGLRQPPSSAELMDTPPATTIPLPPTAAASSINS